MAFHGSCAAFDDDAVVLLGPPGSGKSDLLLRLIDRGFDLVGDDQLVVQNGRVRAADSLQSLLEIRGVGLFNVTHRRDACLRLVVQLGPPSDRLPEPEHDRDLGVPVLTLDPFAASASVKIAWALDALCGRRTQFCGAFTA